MGNVDQSLRADRPLWRDALRRVRRRFGHDPASAGLFSRAIICTCLLLAVAGCAHQKQRQAAALHASGRPAKVEPAQFGPAPAKITQLNTQHQFVVIDFGSRVMPAIGTRLDVYRENKRVGAVQLTEPVRARYATADILEGELQRGDEVR
jgi:hypothetical protein